jgi:hypothetical protein
MAEPIPVGLKIGTVSRTYSDLSDQLIVNQFKFSAGLSKIYSYIMISRHNKKKLGFKTYVEGM